MKRSAVTVGTFDGVHLGHQKVIAELLAVARARNERSVLITFDPHPLYIVRPAEAPKLLTTRAEKEAILSGYDIGEVAFIPFTYELSQYEPARFVREILMGRFGLAHLVIGYDHGFGRGRSGDVETLRTIGSEVGFAVDVVAPHQYEGENVSSSKIRTALLSGDVIAAAASLGRDYSLIGTVMRGDGRGKELGMPTANLETGAPEKLIPLEGIYAVRAHVAGVRHAGVMHIGPRPTIPDAAATLEVHLLDYMGDLYGRQVTVEFVQRLRGIEKFGSLADLAAAMQADGAAAREILAK